VSGDAMHTDPREINNINKYLRSPQNPKVPTPICQRPRAAAKSEKPLVGVRLKVFPKRAKYLTKSDGNR